jgi:4-hydroxymandelate oxidase
LSANAPLSIAEYERDARESLPSVLFDLIFGQYGASGWETNTNNVDGYRRLVLRPRVLAGIGEPRIETNALDEKLQLPVILAPVGLQERCHPEAELASARAAGRAGTILAVSTVASYTLEQIAAAATGALWFQLYFFRDRALNRLLVERAERAGYRAIIVTVDNVAVNSRERYQLLNAKLRQSETAAPGLPASAPVGAVLANFADVDGPGLPTLEALSESLEPRLTWDDIDSLRKWTRLPIVVKGIQTAEDALLCAERGFAGLIVSNHGGHALNGARATIEALPEIAAAVGRRLEVYVDGGIRSGSDVLKAVALGARAVLVGRAMMWGLAAAGEEGVFAALRVIQSELATAMALCGTGDLTTIPAGLVVPRASA